MSEPTSAEQRANALRLREIQYRAALPPGRPRSSWTLRMAIALILAGRPLPVDL